MPIFTIRHVTTYHYKKPVGFGEHRMMLRPRDDNDQKVLESELEITPEPTQLAWTQDIFGNHVATARFADRASELRFESTICVDHAPAGFRAADIQNFARTHPFAYAAEDGPGLTRFIAPLSPSELARWAARFLREDGSADTRELLVDMTQTIRRTFKHVARHEKGTQDPIRTLKLGSGSCRDLAVLMIAALRSLGIAARFVSGYVHLADDDDDDEGVTLARRAQRQRNPCRTLGRCRAPRSDRAVGRFGDKRPEKRNFESRPACPSAEVFARRPVFIGDFCALASRQRIFCAVRLAEGVRPGPNILLQLRAWLCSDSR